jgi:ribulose-phosphate 3-epimerase
MNIKIYPSMLSADPTKLGKELLDIENAGADCIHWDIMDGNYVDAITFGSHIVAAHRKLSSLRFDIHLMIENPDKHIDNFVKAGADFIIVHPETCKHFHKTLQSIKSHGLKSGIALNPATSISTLDYCIDIIDIVLVMTVNPGSSGQIFIESQLEKISKLKNLLPNNIEICIDGGINLNTGKKCIEKGANSLVTGSFLFKSENYAETIKNLKLIS